MDKFLQVGRHGLWPSLSNPKVTLTLTLASDSAGLSLTLCVLQIYLLTLFTYVSESIESGILTRLAWSRATSI